jgi:DNA mismatch repair protein MutS
MTFSRAGDSSHQAVNPAQALGHPEKRANPAPFRSILFDEYEPGADIERREVPDFFTDLNLDQIVASITAGRDEYNLKPFFHTPLSHVETINYRHDIFRDLENHAVFGHIQSFAEDMRTVRGHLGQARKLHYKRQKQSWFLDAVEIYCKAVRRLTSNLAIADVRSRGFVAFSQFLQAYTESADFTSLAADTEKLKTDLSGIRYSLQIQGKRIKIGKYDSEPDYGADVLQTFEKFKQGTPREFRFDFHSTSDMNHVEAAILDLVALVYSETFSFLDEYCNRHNGYLNTTIARFDREVQFYAACLEYADQFKQAGLTLCYPAVTGRSKEVYGSDVFDLALANKLIREKTPVVTNDFFLKDPERMFVVSGPNQGGKTTFARTFGQLHYLASIGCPVPGKEARLFLSDRLFTHFEKEEDIQDLSSKLEEELLRIQRILDLATPSSILIMNESFLSTALNDALFLSKHIMERIIALDMLCVSVTFLDELVSLSETTVSMVSTVNPCDPALRTFKVVRKPADGLAYAVAIAEKYHLTYGGVKARIAEKAKDRVVS